MKQWLLLLCQLLALAAAWAQPGDTLTLEAVMAYAADHALAARRAQADLLQAELRHRSFRASLLPELALNGALPNYLNTFSPTTQPDGTIAFQRISYNNSFLSAQLSQPVTLLGTTLFAQTNLQRYDDFTGDFRRYNGSPLRIGIEQPISAYNPLRWQARLDPVRLREARKQYALAIAAVRETAMQLFFDLLLAQIDGELAQTNLQSSEALYRIAQERYDLGRISENDLLQLQLEQVNARKAVQDAAQATDQAFAQLCNLMGWDAATRFALRVPEAGSLPEIDPETALARAMQHRPEVETWHRRQLEADEATAAAKARNGFQATLQASAGYAASAGTLPPVYTSAQPEQVVGLQLNVPIITWGRARAEVESRRIESDWVAEARRQQTLALENAVRQVLAAYRRVQQTLPLARQAQDIALRQFDISQSRYRLGEISTTDLTLSLRAKDLARRAYIGSLREWWQTRQSLQMLTLDEQ
ncbi:MAG: TolC family protein [Bacteroidia bacterium]